MKKLLLVLLVTALGVGGWLAWQRDGAGNGAHESGSGKAAPTFNKQQFSLDDPESLWVVVNKRRPLAPTEFAPSDLVLPDMPLRLGTQNDEMRLRAEAAHALENMNQAANRAGLELMVASAYRSHTYQRGLYNTYVKQQGQAEADTQSARPGHSEHQTGLAVDLEPTNRVCEVEACFADTPEGEWLAVNAYKYGFIIRYLKDKQAVTGYIYEPWHLRYVGNALAAELHRLGNPTLEEFFELGSASDYQ